MTRRTVALLAGGLVAGAVILGGMGAALAGNTPGPWSGLTPMRGAGYATVARGYGPSSMMGAWAQVNPAGRLLTLNQAQRNVQYYVDQFGNPNLAIDEVMEFQRNFYAIVKDKSTGQGAFEVLVDKVTGAVFPEYGPNMMWNTTYGMKGHMMGYQPSPEPMTVSAAQATRIARRWLQENQPGATTEPPDQFPGYYTLHMRKSERVTGMLSVNGYSGQVWYHTWHGAFIRMKDLHA